MNEEMRLSERGEQLIKHFESCRLKAYKNNPKEPNTIGFGNTFYEDGTPVKEGDVINQKRADNLFKLIIPKFEKMVRAKIERRLFQSEWDALVSFAYNAGTGYKLGHVYKDYNLWGRVNARSTGEEMFNYWTTLAITQSGKKVRGLIRRRKSEVTMFLYSKLDFFE